MFTYSVTEENGLLIRVASEGSESYAIKVPNLASNLEWLLAINDEDFELQDAPLRINLAEVCSQPNVTLDWWERLPEKAKKHAHAFGCDSAYILMLASKYPFIFDHLLHRPVLIAWMMSFDEREPFLAEHLNAISAALSRY